MLSLEGLKHRLDALSNKIGDENIENVGNRVERISQRVQTLSLDFNEIQSFDSKLNGLNRLYLTSTNHSFKVLSEVNMEMDIPQKSINHLGQIQKFSPLCDANIESEFFHHIFFKN